MSKITVHICPNHFEEVKKLFPYLEIKTDLLEIVKKEGITYAASYEPLVNAGYMNRVDIYGW